MRKISIFGYENKPDKDILIFRSQFINQTLKTRTLIFILFLLIIAMLFSQHVPFLFFITCFFFVLIVNPVVFEVDNLNTF